MTTMSTIVLIVAAVAVVPTTLLVAMASMVNHDFSIFVGIFGFLFIFCQLLDRISK